MRASRIVIVSSVLALAFAGLAGCAAPTDDAAIADGEEQETASAKVVLEAKTYENRNERPGPSCDAHMHVMLTRDRSDALRATLEWRLAEGSTCDRKPPRIIKSFAVTAGVDACGVTIYEGTGETGKVWIKDNRERTCPELRPGVLEVSERSKHGTMTFYGEPLGWKPKSISLPVSRAIDAELYTGWGFVPKDSPCRKYVHLVVGSEGDRFVAFLQNEKSATSTCDDVVVPRSRIYEVTRRERFGTWIYEGTRGADTIVINDYRTAQHDDGRSFIYEVQETMTQSDGYYGR